MADNSLALGLAHHADDPQQDDSPAQGDEEGEPVPAMVDVDAQRVKDQAGAECPDDADHNVHQDARAAPLNDLAGEPAGDTADDDVAEPPVLPSRFMAENSVVAVMSMRFSLQTLA